MAPVAISMPAGKTHHLQVEYTDDSGETKVLEVDLPLVMSADTYKIPVIDPASELDTKWISDWLEESGLGTMGTNDPVKLLEKCKAVWLSSIYLVPRLAVTDNRLKAFSLYIVFLSVVSDLPELKKMKGRGSSQKMVQVLGKVVGDIIANKYKSMDELPEVPDKMAPIVKALFLTSVISRRDIPCYNDECAWLVECMGKTLSAMPLLENEFLDETPDTFKYLKSFAGPGPLIELSAMANTVTLPESMRSHLLFQLIMNKASTIVSTTMDIKTLKISLDLDNRLSMVTLWKRKGMTLEVAFNKTVEHLRQDAFEFRLLCFNMRAMNKKNSRLDRFLKHVEEFIDGNTFRPMDQEMQEYEKNKDEVLETIANNK